MLTVIDSPSSLYSIWPTDSSPSKKTPITIGKRSISRYETTTTEAATDPEPETASPVVVTKPSLHMTNAREAKKTIAITREIDVNGSTSSSMPPGK